MDDKVAQLRIDAVGTREELAAMIQKAYSPAEKAQLRRAGDVLIYDIKRLKASGIQPHIIYAALGLINAEMVINAIDREEMV